MSMHDAGWWVTVHRGIARVLVVVALALPALALAPCSVLVAAEPASPPAASEPSKAEASPAESALVNSNQLEKLFEKEITVTAKYHYLLSLPAGYENDDRRWPLMLFLHGSGESGDSLAKVKANGPPKLIAGNERAFPCIVVSPQSPGRGWNPDYLAALLDEICATYRVDPERIYLTGLSMGGCGSWMLAAAQPNRFAAIVPICGGGNPADADTLKGIPIWVFHGAEDKTVKLENSTKMVDALKAVGSDVKFTVYPGVGHDSWTETYANPELYDWLFAQKRAARP
jgi:predicted esterase